ncbi:MULTISPECIES: alanine racemase [unclassified Amycolatopsis]|uniref:alanine racemase n=1 Tax=unclassified Amycolatopsis TaxID=2618356 RepID=UPI001F0D328E|nr:MULTISPECIES: alanine racemase [unclassified Amycolatopsis]
MPPSEETLADPDTPFAVVELSRARRNAERLAQRMRALGVSLRPHTKTAKALPATALMHGGKPGPITASTLAEAEAFADGGYTDITYAVGIDPHKLPRVLTLLRRGITVRVLLDSVAQASAISAAARKAGVRIPSLIEVDCDGHRGGVLPEDPALLTIGRQLHDCLDGVLVHAGESYFATTPAAQREAAAHEREVAVAAAQRLRDEGLYAGTVSVGSTPTAHAADDLTGVTEVRAGNYVFFDLVMVGLGVCRTEDLALSVVVTVIGHRPEHGWILTDGGWMALSRDRGTANQAVDQGYGLVADLDGALVPGLVVTGASQEHGILTAREGHPLPDLPIGTRLRILPNHACATAAQHSGYRILENGRLVDTWQRISGW